MSYVKLSDLGNLDLTFDSEEAPVPAKKKRIAEPTREEVEVEEKRKRGGRNPDPRLKSRERGRKESQESGAYPKNIPREVPSVPSVPPSEEHEWLETDELLYGPGGPPPLANGGVATYPSPAGGAPVEKENKGIEKYLPYLAGMALVGFLIFFWIQKRRASE